MSDKQSELQRAMDEMPTEIQPQRDLWKGIELGIERRQQMAPARITKPNFTPWKYSIAASIFAFAIIGGVLLQQHSTPTTEQSLSLSELANALSEQHNTQKQQLLVSFQDQPALTENWQEQVSELDQAADAIKAALAQDPSNTALLKMLQNIYQQQIHLIERVHSPKWREI